MSLFLWKYASGGLVDDRVLFFQKMPFQAPFKVGTGANCGEQMTSPGLQTLHELENMKY